MSGASGCDNLSDRERKSAQEPVVAITFSGEFTSPRTPDEVYDFLSDATKFGPLLPNFESMSVQDATHFTVKVNLAVGAIHGSVELKMELAEAVRPTRAQYKGMGNAVGSRIVINAGFDLSPVAEGTRVAWKGEAGISGKLASMAGGMLEPLSKKNLQKLIDGLRCALTYPPGQAIAQPAAAEQPVQAPQQSTPSEQPPPSGAEKLPKPE